MATYASNYSPVRLEKSVTLNANNTTQAKDLFIVTGAVCVHRIYGVFTRKGTLANMTDAHFNLNDGTADVAITKATTLTMSTAVVGSIVCKTAGATTNASFLSGAVGGIIEGGTNPMIDFQFVVKAKNTATTKIQWKYTTTDAPMDADVTFYLEYHAFDGGSATTA